MCVLDFDCRFAYGCGFSLDLSFRADSRVTALVGPSGSGKTTVLNLIAGLLRPNDGRIALQDQVLFDAKDKIDLPPERRGIGYVFQDFMLFPHLTVAENLRYGHKRQKSHRIEIDQVVAMLELGDVLKAPARFPQRRRKAAQSRSDARLCEIRGCSFWMNRSTRSTASFGQTSSRIWSASSSISKSRPYSSATIPPISPPLRPRA